MSWSYSFLWLGIACMLSQAPGTLSLDKEAWKHRAQSSALVVGVAVDGYAWVVRPGVMKKGQIKRLPDGRVIAEVPDTSTYLAGTLFFARVQEIVRSKRKVFRGERVGIFVPGLSGTDGTPRLETGGKYLVFLSPLKDEKSELRDTVVSPVDAADDLMETPFHARSYYVVVDDRLGAVEITERSRLRVEAIKAAVKQ